MVVYSRLGIPSGKDQKNEAKKIIFEILKMQAVDEEVSINDTDHTTDEGGKCSTEKQPKQEDMMIEDR